MKDPWHRTISKQTHMYPLTHTYTDTHKCHYTFKLTLFQMHGHTQPQTHTHTHTHTHKQDQHKSTQVQTSVL